MWHRAPGDETNGRGVAGPRSGVGAGSTVGAPATSVPPPGKSKPGAVGGESELERNLQIRRGRERAFDAMRWFLGAILLGIGLAAAPRVATGGDPEDSCVDCHSNPDFLVTNKKLYDYFEDWKKSVHRQEGVGCSDCHGGNPENREKRGAHGAEVSDASVPESTVYFKNIPATCGDCHDDIYGAFRESDHYDHLREKKQDKQGPSCVTCHGSINVTVLDVTTVEKACGRCHNEESDNHPEIPAKAAGILNRFLSIQRYYRYIGIRGEPGDTHAFFQDVDQKIENLSLLWHTFDLPKIEEETDAVVDLLKTKRGEIRRKAPAKSP